MLVMASLKSIKIHLTSACEFIASAVAVENQRTREVIFGLSSVELGQSVVIENFELT
jgi:hypothetical protein